MSAVAEPRPFGELVAVTGVTKHWDAAGGLGPVSFSVGRGEVVAVRGRSGSGKSTLLALLAGWCEPDAGVIARGSLLAAGQTWRSWAGTAIVPQVLGLVEELTVFENVEMVLRLAGRPRAGRDGAVSAILARLDLDEQSSRLPRETSLGQQQRLAVARAAVGGPLLLLADEPTCHQDGDHGSTVMNELRAVADAGGGVVVASHDEAVVAAADQVVSLDD